MNIAKMVSSESHLSSEMYNSMHNWHKLSSLLALGKRSVETKNLYKSNPECFQFWMHCIGFLTFNLKLDHLVNSIKKVNWNTAERTPYLAIRPKFDRKKSWYEMFFYIDTYKGLPRRTKLIFFYAWTSAFQRKVP